MSNWAGINKAIAIVVISICITSLLSILATNAPGCDIADTKFRTLRMCIERCNIGQPLTDTCVKACGEAVK
jgi:hypothetical protein